MIAIVTYVITIGSLIFAIRSKERDERIFYVLLSSSALIYFIDFLADLLNLYLADYPLGIFDELSDLIGNLPILALLLYRIIADSRYIKKESRISLFLGSLVASSGFILLGVLALRVALSTAGIPLSDILLYLPFLIVNILNMALLVTLYILYVEANFRYFLLALLSGYFFIFVGDVFELLYGFYGNLGDRVVARLTTFFGFTLLLVVLLAIRLSNISLSTLKHIEIEREKYKELYLELDDKLRELLVFTQFLRHDFGNDIVVISNALEIYKKNQSVDLLKMAEKRLELMNERISSLRTKEELYSSLKIQAIPITFLEDITKLFKNISTRIKNRKIFIKGNQLLNSVLFNIIDNAFKHGGDSVEVKIFTETKDEYVIIYIVDNARYETWSNLPEAF